MIRKTIAAKGATVPTGYRVSWIKAHASEYVCYPLGLHWIMTRLYRWWVRSKRYSPSDLENKEMLSYRQGFKDGVEGRTEKFSEFETQLQTYYQEEMTNDAD